MMRLIEATNGMNWGKFALYRFSSEDWVHTTQIEDQHDGFDLSPMSLLRYCGWGPEHLLVVDLQTGEGAIFAARPSGHPAADLDKHRIWVCPLFEPFLVWLYEQDLSDLTRLPAVVEIDAAFEWAGYRRPGPQVNVEYASDYRYTEENPLPGPEAAGQFPH